MGRAIGILAHVDAGKTTLSEAILLAGGAIRRAGRVDQGTAALDADPHGGTTPRRREARPS